MMSNYFEKFQQKKVYEANIKKSLKLSDEYVGIYYSVLYYFTICLKIFLIKVQKIF